MSKIATIALAILLIATMGVVTAVGISVTVPSVSAGGCEQSGGPECQQWCLFDPSLPWCPQQE